jgi:hypothetical protein
MKVDPAIIIEIRFRSDGINAVVVTSQGKILMTVIEAEAIAIEWKTYLDELSEIKK